MEFCAIIKQRKHISKISHLLKYKKDDQRKEYLVVEVSTIMLICILTPIILC